ncbi:MAG: helicase-related protein, partial [Alphaproteobacteria bacterium]
MERHYTRPRITAVLGPTNTGKTYLAIERMLGHRSGMIGFPLRLLARENYDRVCKARGAAQVALITGEERIIPAQPRYFLCTVEAMPLDRRVAFLAVDEIQLCADPERGHVFTNRLLEARGEEETMFLGAETIGPMIARLLPEAHFVTRNRMSRLSYTGPKKLTRLPRRSAVIGFSASAVYGLAEMLRRQRGGTAVVLGALSPRTRNAQVAMYEAGEVDYLVATDAIGMGLNMAIDHVAFSGLIKFDGRQPRHLSAPEIAQIAGRAGRHMSDGTFGTTNELSGLEPQLVEALEDHQFDRLKTIYWRNGVLDFSSLDALQRSLAAPPPGRGLVRARAADDLLALKALRGDEEVVRLAGGGESVALLWDVCQVPDFRKALGSGHARLVGRIFKYLMSDEGVLPVDWVARSISRLDRTDGDIDTLVGRIAHIRTWTYISHRGDWLEDAAHWQGQARALEDKLSDALHEGLTQRFVDRRAAALVSRISAGETLLGAVTQT